MVEVVVYLTVITDKTLERAAVLNNCIACSRRRNGKCEFSHLSLDRPPQSCLSATPISRKAAPKDGNLSVVKILGEPCLRIIFIGNFFAAALLRRLVT